MGSQYTKDGEKDAGMLETSLRVERLTAERFAAFGQATLEPAAAPTSSGEG